MDNEIKQRSSRIVHENNWMRVREDQVEFGDGTPGVFGVIEKLDFAVIVPLHADGRIEMVEQYRYPVGQRMWELPMGSVGSTFDPEQVARIELAEETGLQAGKMEPVQSFFQAPGYATQKGYVFIATQLTRGQANREASEQGMRTGLFTLDEIKQMMTNGQIGEAVSIAALCYLIMIGRIG